VARRFFLILGILVLLSLPLRAQRLFVEAPPALQPTASRLQALDPIQILEAARLVGLTDPGPPIRVMLAEEGSPQALSAPRWVAGYALPEQGLVVLLPARSPSYPDSTLEDLLRHEVAHVLVGRASGLRPLPRWFHEGVAMVAGSSWGMEEQTRLATTLVSGGEVSLAEIDRRFTGGEGEVRSAYTLAGAFVRDLLSRYGSNVLGEILAGVASGLSFDAAFLRATGTPLAGAERAFWASQTLWYRWVPFLSSSVVLWILVTLLALWAIRRRRRRDAARLAEWAAEEAVQRETRTDTDAARTDTDSWTVN
jgi:hypothetical protein